MLHSGIKNTLRIFILIALLVALSGGLQTASAQSMGTVRTIFIIGSHNGIITWPLRAFTVSDGEFFEAETWRPISRGVGPSGLAVDPYNEHLFVSYEGEGSVDIYDATDATPLGQITLVGTTDLAGMDIHEGRGHFYAIDRRVNNIYVFDTTTFAPVEQWTLPSGQGAWDIEIIENLDGRDVIFVTDSSTTIRWYDIDTHEEVGSVTQLTSVAVGLGVYINADGYPVILTASILAYDSPYLVKYDVETMTEDSINLGTTARGVEVNQQDALAYVTVGGTLVSKPSLRSYDIETLTETTRIDLTAGWSPCDVKATWLTFGSSVKKDCTTHPDGQINMQDDVTFTLTVKNKYSRPIHVLPLKDVYDTTQLSFVSATPATDDSIDDGEVGWADLIPIIGHDLVTDEEYTVTLNFKAVPECTSGSVTGVNLGQMTGAQDDQGDTIEDASGSFDYTIWCNCITDADCDDGVWCNGVESCVDRQCKPGVNPCPIDDGLWCNGEETITCIEETQECGHTGTPCSDDGNLCNGEETCDEEADMCGHSGDPCVDDGLWCNGTESCDPTKIECDHSGSPCEDGDYCNEDEDSCDPFSADDDTVPVGDDEEAGWPEGNVTGGCCGCGD